MTIIKPKWHLFSVHFRGINFKKHDCCSKGTSQKITGLWIEPQTPDQFFTSLLLSFPLVFQIFFKNYYYGSASPPQFHRATWLSRLSCDWFSKYFLCSKLELPSPAGNCPPFNPLLSIEMLGSHPQLVHLFRNYFTFRVWESPRKLTNMQIPGPHFQSVCQSVHVV